MIAVKLDLEKVEKKFKKLEQKALRPKRTIDIIAAKAWRNVLDHFKTQSTPEGKKWQGWKHKGKRVRVRPYGRGGSMLLQDTGYLRMSTRFKTVKSDAIVYNKTEYADYQNKMRKFMGIDKATRKKLKSVLQKGLFRS